MASIACSSPPVILKVFVCYFLGLFKVNVFKTKRRKIESFKDLLSYTSVQRLEVNAYQVPAVPASTCYQVTAMFMF